MFSFLILQLSTDGLLVFGDVPAPDFITANGSFPTNLGYYLVAPFWVDLDYSSGGSISYEIHSCISENGVSRELLERTSSFVSSAKNLSFQGTWMFVERWEEVPGVTSSDNTVSLQFLLQVLIY